MLYFALITLQAYRKKMRQLRMTITSISVKENSPDLNLVDYRIGPDAAASVQDAGP